MKVALLANSFPPEQIYGVARYIEDLAYSLTRIGQSVDVICCSSHGSRVEMRDGFRIIWVKGHKTGSVFPAINILRCSYGIWRALNALHRKHRYDVVEFANWRYPGFFATILKFSALAPILVVRLSTSVSLNPPTGPTAIRIGAWLEGYQTRRVHGVISNTAENLRTCERVYQWRKQLPKIVISHGLPCGAEPEFHFNAPPARIVLFVGRIEARKGFDVLAKAWSLVLAEVPNARLVVIGEDANRNGGMSYYQWSLISLSHEEQESIDYLGGVGEEERERMYKACDVLVIPSRYESFGLVILEAMRYGKPVIASRAGGIPEVIEDGKTGVLVPVDDYVSLSEAIIRLLKDDKMRLEMGRLAFKEIETKFTMKRVAIQTGNFYAKLIEARREHE